MIALRAVTGAYKRTG